jgi:uncharacterized membrane protein
MSVESPLPARLESALARILSYGTWFACALIAAGLAQTMSGWNMRAAHADGPSVIAAGIVIFIALPAVRVVVMLVAFLRNREYRFSVAAAFVLLMMAIGCILGSM